MTKSRVGLAICAVVAISVAMFGPSFDLYLRFFLRRNYRKAKKQTSLDYASVFLLPSLTTAVIRVAAKNGSERSALAEITRFFCRGSVLAVD